VPSCLVRCVHSIFKIFTTSICLGICPKLLQTSHSIKDLYALPPAVTFVGDSKPLNKEMYMINKTGCIHWRFNLPLKCKWHASQQWTESPPPPDRNKFSETHISTRYIWDLIQIPTRLLITLLSFWNLPLWIYGNLLYSKFCSGNLNKSHSLRKYISTSFR
jgi:hypothetical protein